MMLDSSQLDSQRLIMTLATANLILTVVTTMLILRHSQNNF